MDYLIIYRGEPVGKIVEIRADRSMGMVYGRLVPNPVYDKVRAVFRLGAEAQSINAADRKPEDKERLDRYERERDALCLSITTVDGVAVPVEWVHVYDYSDELGLDGYDAEFHINTQDFFEDARLWSETD